MKKKTKQTQPLDFSRLSADNQTRMREAVLASNAAARPIAPVTPVIYMLTVPTWESPQVLAAAGNVPHRHTLPVPISPAFLHIVLELGSVAQRGLDKMLFFLQRDSHSAGCTRQTPPNRVSADSPSRILLGNVLESL